MRPISVKGGRRRGEPVWVLMVILGGWVGMRVATAGAAGIEPEVVSGLGQVMRALPFHTGAQAPSLPVAARKGPSVVSLSRPASSKIAMPRPSSVGPAGVGGHQLLWMGAMTNLPLASDVARVTVPRPDAGQAAGGLRRGTERTATAWQSPRAAPFLTPPSAPVSPPVATADRPRLPRWSGDAWLLWRRGGNGAPTGPLVLPSYGADQVGAVLRYRLAPTSSYQPSLYGRAYSALNGTGEREAALGFAARPVPAVPIIAMAEGRLSRFDNGTNHLRPAVTLVTQLPPVMLPGKLRAETYVQGGYVGGPGATPFVDGQFRLEQVALDRSRVQLRVGGGVWGGAQQGAGRLDVGPGVTLGFATARAGAHVSFDWRFRVAGEAMPTSGPAVTLAAGF